MRLRRSAALAATALLIAVPAVVGQVSAAGPNAAAAKAAAEHARIVAHWTPSRLRAAIPRDLVVTAHGAHIAPTKKPGPGGGGGGGAGNTSGASWPNGKGLVYRATGKVYFEMGGGAWVCSGTAVNDSRSGVSLVLTAGHCVYDEENGHGQLSGFATNWLFIPQFDSAPTFTCGNTAYGCWTAQAIVVHNGYASAGGFNNQAVLHDWAFVAVGAGGKSGTAALDSTVGSFGSAFTEMSLNTVAAAFGYPASGKYRGNDLTYCQNPTTRDSAAGTNNYRMACNMTGGSSGGPWFSGFGATTGDTGTIRSLNSYGYSGQTAMFGPIFNTKTNQTFNAAVSATGNTIVN